MTDVQARLLLAGIVVAGAALAGVVIWCVCYSPSGPLRDVAEPAR